VHELTPQGPRELSVQLAPHEIVTVELDFGRVTPAR
jgi:hypothetical protein